MDSLWLVVCSLDTWDMVCLFPPPPTTMPPHTTTCRHTPPPTTTTTTYTPHLPPPDRQQLPLPPFLSLPAFLHAFPKHMPACLPHTAGGPGWRGTMPATTTSPAFTFTHARPLPCLPASLYYPSLCQLSPPHTACTHFSAFPTSLPPLPYTCFSTILHTHLFACLFAATCLYLKQKTGTDLDPSSLPSSPFSGFPLV